MYFRGFKRVSRLSRVLQWRSRSSQGALGGLKGVSGISGLLQGRFRDSLGFSESTWRSQEHLRKVPRGVRGTIGESEEHFKELQGSCASGVSVGLQGCFSGSRGFQGTRMSHDHFKEAPTGLREYQEVLGAFQGAPGVLRSATGDLWGTSGTRMGVPRTLRGGLSFPGCFEGMSH